MNKSKTFLALGDSYTIGESVLEMERWPVKLVELLNASGDPFDQPIILAKTGWTTDELLIELNKSSLSPTYDLVSLLIGVNNQYRNYPEETYSYEFEVLVMKAVFLAGNIPTHVVVLSIPDWGVTPFATGRDRNEISTQIDTFNRINKRISGLYGVKYVEITVASRNAAGDYTLIASDGLHPSGKMYSQWAESVYRLR